jgi:replicative DNA helicase
MIDNVRFAGGALNNGERTDQILEAMYAWARSLAVKYDHAGIAMSQLSSDAENNRWPAQSMLKDSKTGKQGACDFIIAGGYDQMMPETRFFSLPKNKLKLEGRPSSPRCPLYFDADRSQFYLPASADDQQEDLNNAA